MSAAAAGRCGWIPRTAHCTVWERGNCSTRSCSHTLAFHRRDSPRTCRGGGAAHTVAPGVHQNAEEACRNCRLRGRVPGHRIGLYETEGPGRRIRRADGHLHGHPAHLTVRRGKLVPCHGNRRGLPAHNRDLHAHPCRGSYQHSRHHRHRRLQERLPESEGARMHAQRESGRIRTVSIITEVPAAGAASVTNIAAIVSCATNVAASARRR